MVRTELDVHALPIPLLSNDVSELDAKGRQILGGQSFRLDETVRGENIVVAVGGGGDGPSAIDVVLHQRAHDAVARRCVVATRALHASNALPNNNPIRGDERRRDDRLSQAVEHLARTSRNRAGGRGQPNFARVVQDVVRDNRIDLGGTGDQRCLNTRLGEQEASIDVEVETRDVRADSGVLRVRSLQPRVKSWNVLALVAEPNPGQA